MKTQVFLKIIAVLYINFFFINETNAQCKPNAGYDGVSCNTTTGGVEGILSDTNATALWSLLTGTGSVVFTDSTKISTGFTASEKGAYVFVLKETLGTCVDYDTVVIILDRLKINACIDCYRLENATTSTGEHVKNVAVDTVCFNDFNDKYFLNASIDTTVYELDDTTIIFAPISNNWEHSSSGIILANDPNSSVINDTLSVIIFNSETPSYNNYYTLILKADDNYG